jgi:hypothetical protein
MTETHLQGVAHELSKDARKAIDRARKILDMASRPINEDATPSQRKAQEAEQAVAAERFQAVLLEYNLTQAMVEQSGGAADGRREEAKLKAGVYEWQRNLWEAVAELNFCYYYCRDVWRTQEYTKTLWDGTKAKRTRSIRGKEHKLIGRVVNVQAAVNLCQYIEAAIEKATRDKLAEQLGTACTPLSLSRQLFSRFAVSFREGAADDVISRVNTARAQEVMRQTKAAEEIARRARENAEANPTMGTALTIADYAQSEEDLNRDFMRGKEPGTTTREKAERAAKEAAEEAAYIAWAKENPEEARAKAKAEQEESDRYWARRQGNYRGGPAPKERDHRAYRQGSDAGSKIGLNIQAGSTKSAGSIG